jgi:hypothetical protein
VRVQWEAIGRSISYAMAAFAVGALLDVAAFTGAHYTFPHTWFFQAGLAPPWYLIGRDLIDGLWGVIECLALFVFTAVARRTLGPAVWWASVVAVPSIVNDIGLAVNVWLHTNHSLSRSLATTTWSTLDAYWTSRMTASWVSLALAAVLLLGSPLVFGVRASKTERERS